MASILEMLNNTFLMPAAAIEQLEQYIASEYPGLSKEAANKILIQYLEQKIEGQLSIFDEKYLPYIKFRLILNTVARRPYAISAADILKACLLLNFENADFYDELNIWLRQTLQADLSEAAVGEFIDKLRQWVNAHPEQAVDELLQVNSSLDQQLPDTPLKTGAVDGLPGQTDPADWASQVNSNIYFNGYNTTEAAEEAKGTAVADGVGDSGKLFQSANWVAVAGMSILLLAGGAWVVTTVPREKASDPQLNRRATLTARLPVEERTELKLDHYSVKTRESRNQIVNRSRVAGVNSVKPKPAALKRVAAEQPAGSKTVIVGYEEVVTDDRVRKVPVIQSFSSKFNMKATAYTVPASVAGEPADNTSSDAGVTNEGIPGNEVGAAAVNTAKNRAVKGRTIAVDPRVIPLGSRVYIKFPEEYRSLSGIYFAEDNRLQNQGQRIGIYFGEESSENDVARKNSEAFGSRNVEVYVLK